MFSFVRTQFLTFLYTLEITENSDIWGFPIYWITISTIKNCIYIFPIKIFKTLSMLLIHLGFSYHTYFRRCDVIYWPRDVIRTIFPVGGNQGGILQVFGLPKIGCGKIPSGSGGLCSSWSIRGTAQELFLQGKNVEGEKSLWAVVDKALPVSLNTLGLGT